MINCEGNTRLEDFGVGRVAGPKNRLEEYKAQCRELPNVRQARWWLQVLEHDPEVRTLVATENAGTRQRRRVS